jgi:Uma2 family endonuclease
MPNRVPEMAAPAQHVATEDDLLATPQDGQKYELVDGAIVVSPAGSRHGQVSVRVASRLHDHVEKGRLGHVFDSSTGFRLPGGNVRSPDVSFVAKGRFANERVPEDFSDVPPDLAVEVLSPRDRPRHVLDKIGEYLQAGVRLVWVVDPQRERGAVYRSLTDIRELALDDELDGGEVVPGFRCSLRSILER